VISIFFQKQKEKNTKEINQTLKMLTVQFTNNFTHAWHFLHGTTCHCDTFHLHVALQHGTRQICMAWLFLLPATHGLATAVIKPHGSSSSLDV